MSATHLAIANLLGQPSLTQHQIADIVGVHRNTVANVAAKIAKAAGENPELNAYRKLVKKRLPHQKAVDVLEMSMKDVRFALPALKYRDELLGLAPKRAETEAATQQGPVIVFQQGGKINFGASDRRAIGDGSGESE